MEHAYPQDRGPAMSAEPVDGTTRNPILENPQFRALVKQRRIFSWCMTALMLAVYFGFILSLAFIPAHLGTPITVGQPMTWGVPIGFGMLAFTILIVAVYVWRTNTCYDPKIKTIIRSFDK
ncbi:DUF485 domain-containing protein [Pseudomonas sp. R5(2019)]|uniref:DUF485 domain-containing protein n=1 Tax=Pseudomonas sp. R5(2019) TaxID=2697566 RepID=UPI0014123BCE|nr:DUF485 domain-containing protein [Pseudomonas sp. R5(2019)]NBA93586.1 DUF485 domain-containing protein [Pseudomonas sp. R5(2019)]